MAKDVLQDIADTYSNLDIFGEASELEAAQFVDEMSGDTDYTPDEDQNVPDSMPLPDALNLVDASRADGFTFAKNIAEQMLAQYSAKAEDVKATQDSRTLHANMSLALKKLLVEWGARIAEAEERVQQSTSDERRKLGVNVAEILEPKEPIICGPSSLEGKPKSYPAPSAGVQANTKRAQEFLAKK
jgi:ABC-type amino acid transport substrate-binding protein